MDHRRVRGAHRQRGGAPGSVPGHVPRGSAGGAAAAAHRHRQAVPEEAVRRTAGVDSDGAQPGHFGDGRPRLTRPRVHLLAPAVLGPGGCQGRGARDQAHDPGRPQRARPRSARRVAAPSLHAELGVPQAPVGVCARRARARLGGAGRRESRRGGAELRAAGRASDRGAGAAFRAGAGADGGGPARRSDGRHRRRAGAGSSRRERDGPVRPAGGGVLRAASAGFTRGGEGPRARDLRRRGPRRARRARVRADVHEPHRRAAGRVPAAVQQERVRARPRGAAARGDGPPGRKPALLGASRAHRPVLGPERDGHAAGGGEVALAERRGVLLQRPGSPGGAPAPGRRAGWRRRVRAAVADESGAGAPGGGARRAGRRRPGGRPDLCAALEPGDPAGHGGDAVRRRVLFREDARTRG